VGSDVESMKTSFQGLVDKVSKRAQEEKEEFSSGAENLNEQSKDLPKEISEKVDESKSKVNLQAENLKKEGKNLWEKASEKIHEAKTKIIPQEKNLEKQDQDLPEQTDETERKIASAIEDLRHSSHQIIDKTKSKIGELKERISPTDYAKLLDDDVKENKEKVLEEIKHLPNIGPEDVIEGQGQHEEKSLKQRISGKVEDLKDRFRSQEVETEKTALPFAEPQQSLRGKVSEGIHDISDKISGKIEGVKEKFKSEGEQEPEKTLPNEETSQPSKKSGESLLSSFMGHVYEISGNIFEKIDDMQAKNQPKGEEKPESSQNLLPETLTSEPFVENRPAFMEKTKESIHNLSDKISGKMEHLKDRFRSEKAEPEPTQKSEGEFHAVTTGFSENIDDLRREKRLEELGGEELISDNPFLSLASEKSENIVQPLLPTEIVGGNVQSLTEGIKNDQTLLSNEMESEFTGEQTSLGEKIRAEGKVIGVDITNLGHRITESISNTTSKISEKIIETKEKIKSKFESEDKDNLGEKTDNIEAEDKENVPYVQ